MTAPRLSASGLLGTIQGPGELQDLEPWQLPGLAQEIREFLIDKVGRAGGHLGPNLGSVELTIALHRVFTSPTDKIVFDTGHQAYVHKILTGRAAGFDSLRQQGGLSGYPSRAESEHDVIENSHASTALSYADGLARAFHLAGTPQRHAVAVIGDGALTGGMCWEALNNIGGSDRRVVVVLNDNGRSYAPTTGAVAAHLARLRRQPSPEAGAANLFELAGLRYLGPVDGHDFAALEHALRAAAATGGPALVHVVTVKGRGHAPAEEHEADRFHSIAPAPGPDHRPAPGWTSVFGQEIARIGAERPDVVCLTAAMLDPCGLTQFADRFPERIIDVGIAEQHAVTCAAGLALGGLHPVVAIYASFITRAFDQVLMDVALHQLPVTLVLDRAGVTGPDGPSHHGMWDASVLPCVPGLYIAAPRDPARLRELLREAITRDDSPTALRFPRATAGPDIPALRTEDGIDVLHDSHRPQALIVAAGAMAQACVAAAQQLSEQHIEVTVVDPRWIAPLPQALTALAGTYRDVLCVEDTVEVGALGQRLGAGLAKTGPARTRVATAALGQSFITHANRDQILQAEDLTAQGIARTVRQLVRGDP